MANTSGCSQQLKDLELSNTSCTMADSTMQTDFAMASRASEDDSTISSAYVSAVEEQIERSKVHWSTLVDHSGDTDDDEVDFEVSNKREFLALQGHSIWGRFFANFTGDGLSTGLNHGDRGELVVGKKFAEGGQAELYEAHVKWNNPRTTEYQERRKLGYVLKVFKEGTLLKHIKSNLPQGLLQQYARSRENMRASTPKRFPQFRCKVFIGILLKSGRFAFLMEKYNFDLRTLIEHNMKLRSDEHPEPFSKEEATIIMYDVALGVEWLHTRDIVHRDLKASNVLVKDRRTERQINFCLVADYECSIGVVGTNFFRAPEILHACRERQIRERPEVFSKSADVYSYGMTCYEILAGKLPFEDHPLSDSPSLLIDLVINQHLRPEIPEYVEDWICELLGGCWQSDPIARPTIGEILEMFSSNSTKVRRREVRMKDRFGDEFRSLY